MISVRANDLDDICQVCLLYQMCLFLDFEVCTTFMARHAINLVRYINSCTSTTTYLVQQLQQLCVNIPGLYMWYIRYLYGLQACISPHASQTRSRLGDLKPLLSLNSRSAYGKLPVLGLKQQVPPPLPPHPSPRLEATPR